MAFLEAKIDFPEEEDPAGYERPEIKKRAKLVLEHINKLISSYENGKITSEGLKIALIGPPNAGKSTLMNYFLQKDRAIVTDTPGTTRDYLEEKALFRGRLISIIDTAGLRETADLIEQQGVVQAKKIAKEVDLILFLFPSDQDQETFNFFRNSIKGLLGMSHINLLTKVDLNSKLDFKTDEALLPISCHSQENLEKLVDQIVAKVDFHTNEFKNNVSITSTRHLSLLESAGQRLEQFIQNLDEPNYDEILAFELREINQTLGKIIGQIHTDDILGEIFSRFCIGK